MVLPGAIVDRGIVVKMVVDLISSLIIGGALFVGSLYLVLKCNMNRLLLD